MYTERERKIISYRMIEYKPWIFIVYIFTYMYKYMQGPSARGPNLPLPRPLCGQHRPFPLPKHVSGRPRPTPPRLL